MENQKEIQISLTFKPGEDDQIIEYLRTLPPRGRDRVLKQRIIDGIDRENRRTAFDY